MQSPMDVLRESRSGLYTYFAFLPVTLALTLAVTDRPLGMTDLVWMVPLFNLLPCLFVGLAALLVGLTMAALLGQHDVRAQAMCRYGAVTGGLAFLLILAAGSLLTGGRSGGK